MQQNDGKDSFLSSLLVMPVEMWTNCCMKQQSNRHIQGHLWTTSVDALPWGTEPNSTQQVRYVGIQ